MKFHGRERQERQIHEMFRTENQETILIFGRRRIGKSELIKQCLKETRIQSIYFECKQTLARSGRTWF